MGKSIYKKDIGGFLHLDLEPLYKEVEYDITVGDLNYDTIRNKHWLDHSAISEEMEDTIREILEKHGVKVRYIKFAIEEQIEDIYDIF